MFIGASSEGPMELSLVLSYPKFIDACVSRMHQPFRVEFPVFIAIGPKPIAGASVITAKPATCGQFKTGHFVWPET
jgi:hypothetical protein